MFLDWLGKKLGYTKKEDWYQISIKEIVDNGGTGLLFHFDKSPQKLLSAVYGDDFLPWRFAKVPQSTPVSIYFFAIISPFCKIMLGVLRLLERGGESA